MADIRTQQTVLEDPPYSYMELVGLKFFICCKKNRSRTEKFREHMKIIADRMDIRNIVLCEGNISALSNIMMLPYQMKINSHFKKAQDDETKIAYTIPIGQAIKELMQKANNPNIDPVENEINKLLLEIVRINTLGQEAHDPATDKKDPSDQ